MIIKNEALLREFRRKDRCELCHRLGHVQVHHVYCRGLGGGHRLDIRENLISLCWRCHRLFHDGLLRRDHFIEIIAYREGRSVEDITGTILRYRNAKKGDTWEGQADAGDRQRQEDVLLPPEDHPSPGNSKESLEADQSWGQF